MVVADTDIIIAAIRGNTIAKQLLIKYSPNVHISIVTEMELYVGATNETKKKIVLQVLASHEVLSINKSICNTASNLIKNYNTKTRKLYMPEALIAATCIENNFALLTFNTKDFKFIKGLKLVA